MSEREPAGVCPWCGAAFTHGTPDCKGFGCGSRFGLITDQTEYCLEQQRDQLKARIAELERERDNFHAESIELQKENVDLERRFEELQAAIKAGANDCPICTGSGELVDGVYAWDCGESPPSCGACKGTGRTSGMVERISDLESERNALTLERDAARDEMRIFRDRSRSVSERRVRLIERLAKEWRQFRSERDGLRAELSRLRENPRTARTCHRCKISIGACDATVSEGERHYHALCKVVERADAAEAEVDALRSRLGADDDDLPLSNEWLTATLGDAWIIEVENGKLNIMDERPGDDEDEEQELAAWFQMVGRFDMVCVRPEVKTRGDVRRLVAALKPADAGGEATQ